MIEKTPLLFTEDHLKAIGSYHFAYVSFRLEQHHLTICLDRRQKKNAINEIVKRELGLLMTYAANDSEVWTVSIEAKGTVFSAGADLSTFLGKKDLNSGSTVPEELNEIIIGDLFSQLNKPCLAIIEGDVYAGGFLLFSMCTHVFANETIQFTLSEVHRGIWPFQVMAALLRHLPDKFVLQWCMEGTTMTAQKLMEKGLIDELITNADRDKKKQDWIDRLHRGAPTAIQLGISSYEALNKVQESDRHAFLNQCLQQCVQTPNAIEGMMAFREKRQPNWHSNEE